MTPGHIASAAVDCVAVTAKTTWRFVRLRTTTGLEGTGEFTFQPAPTDAAEQMRAAANLLVGAAANRAALAPLSAMAEEGFARATVFSALEQALADIEAQAAGLPLCRYLGARSARRVPLYANINRRTVMRTPEGFAQSARLAAGVGFTAMKLAPFDGLSPKLCGTEEGRERTAEGLARIKAVADAVPEAAVMVDCHWRFSEDAAHAVLPALEDARVSWFECPLAETVDNVPALTRLRHAANGRGMRLAGLETMAGWASFEPFVVGGAYDVVMPDIKHCGGHAALIDIAERSAEHGVAVSAHNPSGPVAHVHSLHVTACLPGDEPLELQFDETEKFWELTTPPPPECNGRSALPTGSGVGVALDLDGVAGAGPG